jgi:alginate O-acetyltransferase complex protein AlgI
LIANVLGETVTDIYKLDPILIDTSLSWVAAIAYTMQLYFDFSGYSDMAIGLGEMLGFRIPENFNFPYISKSITEFWKRWHISLGNWMRNYLYIPLGGNKAGKYATYFNLWLVFLLSGIWHGAGWNYLIWGAFHGFFLVIERLFLQKYLKRTSAIIYTFIVVTIGWVLFKMKTFL